MCLIGLLVNCLILNFSSTQSWSLWFNLLRFIPSRATPRLVIYNCYHLLFTSWHIFHWPWKDGSLSAQDLNLGPLYVTTPARVTKFKLVTHTYNVLYVKPIRLNQRSRFFKPSWNINLLTWKDSMLDEPSMLGVHVEHCRVSNQGPLDCESGEPTTTLSYM